MRIPAGIRGRLCILWGLILAPVVFSACNKEATDKGQPSALPEIMVVFSPGGLGDRSYNDQILRGIEKAANEIEEDYYLSFYSPESMEETEMLIEFWWMLKDIPADEEGNISRKLLILGSQEYAEMARDIVDVDELNNDLCILAFEQDDTGDETDLFLVNSYFIFLSAAIVLSLLKVPKVRELTEKEQRRLNRAMVRNTIIVTIPSIVPIVFMILGIDPFHS